jgi:hypothetical protein
MKETLEYKILKYLSDNDNGEYIDVSELSYDKKLLRNKLRDLSKDQLIKYSGGIDMRFGDGDGIKIDHIKAKIEFKGKQELSNIENQSLVFSINQETNKYNANKYKPWYKKFPKKLWKLISENKLISGLLIILILYLIKLYFGIDLKNP